MKKKTLFLIVIFLAFCSAAQTTKREAQAIRISLMGDAYLKDGAFDKAIYYYQVALDAYPSYVKTQYQLAQSYRLANQPDSAVYHYESIISNEQDVRYPMSRYHLAMIQMERNEYQSARENLTAFREVLIQQKLNSVKRFKDFFEQAETEIHKLSK